MWWSSLGSSDLRALQELLCGRIKDDTILPLFLPFQLSFKKLSSHSQGKMKPRQPAKQIHLSPYWKVVEADRALAFWIKSLKLLKKKNDGRNERKETPKRKAGLSPTTGQEEGGGGAMAGDI